MLHHQSSISPEQQLEQDVVTRLCQIVDSPRSLAVHLLVSNDEHEQLLDLEIKPDDYDDHAKFADDLLVTKVLSKSKHLNLNRDLKQAAVDSFFEGEDMCKDTNDRILTGQLDHILADISAIVARIVGPLGRRDLENISRSFRNGSGATVSTAGHGVVPSQKMRDIPSLTHSVLPFTRVILGDRLSDSFESFDVVEGNRFTSVPKNSKTDRGICIEPSLNMFGQLGVGTFLKRRLKSFGIDLFDQSTNQEYARKCVTNEGCTIDLSLASDSISLSLVYRLFPPKWFHLLSLFRSPCTLMPDGINYTVEKFSSMGNGYTFEVETIIFLAIAIYCNDGEFDPSTMTVYGDDIIIPRALSSKMYETLELLGFRVNAAKSFLAGRFFESCGTDWYDSMPVRPFFLTGDSSNMIPYSLQVCNLLRLYAHRRGNYHACDARFKGIWEHFCSLVPKNWRRPVPLSYGDTGVIVADNEHNCSRLRDGIEGFKVTSVSMRPKKRRYTDLAYLLYKLHRGIGGCQDVPDQGNHEIIRGYLGKARLNVSSIQAWTRDIRWEELPPNLGRFGQGMS